MSLVETTSNRHDVVSDGGHVWVTGPDGTCVARLRPRTEEHPGTGEVLEQSGQWKLLPGESFLEWTFRVQLHHDVAVDDEHRPGVRLDPEFRLLPALVRTVLARRKSPEPPTFSELLGALQDLVEALDGQQLGAAVAAMEARGQLTRQQTAGEPDRWKVAR